MAEMTPEQAKTICATTCRRLYDQFPRPPTRAEFAELVRAECDRSPEFKEAMLWEGARMAIEDYHRMEKHPRDRSQ